MSSTQSPPNPSPLYDHQEAREMLSELTKDWEVHKEARKVAGRKLMEEFGDIATQLGITVQDVTSQWRGSTLVLKCFPNPGTTGVLLSLSGDTLLLRLDAPTAEFRTLSLRFNAGDRRFEGMEIDQEIVPVPGERRARRRSALAVLVREIFNTVGT
ncbi:hypothetical protein [Hyalangium sp.]|uniref:hypothetical protein n=1 Tax=Hyalangium sp. TaxID=2028555 RepID=UPI002D27A0E6|nr:hypothetical protein [Hyalangium sp.]HYH98051.1 hypothetical protein [Hyalangium sp.]